MTTTRWIGIGAGILLMLTAFGLVVWQGANSTNTSGVAFAQADATATAQPAATATIAATQAVTPTQSTTAPNTSNIGDAFWAILAGKLGVNVDDLKSKAVESRKQMIDQAVTDGRTTQTEADSIKGKLDANGLIAPIYLGRNANGTTPSQTPNQFPGRFGRGGPFFGMRGGGFFPGIGLDGLDSVAKSLNLTSADLVKQLRDGKTLADIAKAQNVDEATVKQAIITARNAQLDREVQLGILTQDQADALKKLITVDNIDLSRKYFGFGFGMMQR